METKTFRRNALNYFIKTLNGMALGLFSTLIIGVIIGQVGKYTGIVEITNLSITLRGMMGIGIGLGVAYSLGLARLHLIAGAVAGGIAASIKNDPMVIYLTTLAAIEGFRFIIRKATPVDIIIVPLISSAIALMVALIIGAPVAAMMSSIGNFVNTATTYQPFFMGVIIAVIMGMALTAPISSAAIAISIGLSGIAGGAAAVGCATQMIGFAVMSRKDNNIGTVISIAIGTSMLQFKNILKNPIIWLPTIITSAILGPLSTLLFQMENIPSGSGMGTSGLIGQIGTFDAMGYTATAITGVILLHFVLPIVLVGSIDWYFRKKTWIKQGDLLLEV